MEDTCEESLRSVAYEDGARKDTSSIVVRRHQIKEDRYSQSGGAISLIVSGAVPGMAYELISSVPPLASMTIKPGLDRFYAPKF